MKAGICLCDLLMYLADSSIWLMHHCITQLLGRDICSGVTGHFGSRFQGVCSSFYAELSMTLTAV